MLRFLTHDLGVLQINKIQVLYLSAYNHSLLYSSKAGQIAQDFWTVSSVTSLTLT